MTKRRALAGKGFPPAIKHDQNLKKKKQKWELSEGRNDKYK